MNRAVTRPHSRETDPLAVNSTTLHQYYNTVQSDDASDDLVDAAMLRRRAMALQGYRRRTSPGRLAAVAVALLLSACVLWWFR